MQICTADGTETAVTSRKTLDKSCTLTPKLFFQAAAQLGAMNADPIGDSYIAIIHPYAAYDLKTCTSVIATICFFLDFFLIIVLLTSLETVFLAQLFRNL